MNYRLTKQAAKRLKKILKSDLKTAKRIKDAIILLSENRNLGEALQGHSDFRKIRVGKYRLIHTKIDGVTIIAIIEKRETVYETFQHLLKNSDFLDL